MAIYCSKCGKQHPDDANFCMGCGQPFKAGVAETRPAITKWEYRDVVIPLNFKVEFKNGHPQSDAGSIADRIILTYLQHEAQQGWEIEGVSEFWAIREYGRVREEHITNIFGTLRCVNYHSATIRLKHPSRN